ncbi:hypothetical protein FRB99_004225 [Tulasnella sp. 403]|nr:hypothetical protein FRB99_004225 [Tulasnella sp. 403]
MDDKIEELQEQVKSLTEQVHGMRNVLDEQLEDVRTRQDDVARILDRIVYIGLRGGWAEMDDTALRIPVRAAPVEASSSGASQEVKVERRVADV